MISVLMCVALVIYGLYLYRCKDPWAIKFTSLMGLLLVLSVWKYVSLNYLELSVGVRKIETIIIGSGRVAVFILLVTKFAKDDIIPYLKNRFRKKR